MAETQYDLFGAEPAVTGVAEPVVSLDAHRARTQASAKSREDEAIANALAILEKRLTSRREGTAIERPSDASNYLKLKLAGREQEVFAVMFLDNRHRVIAYEEMFKGTIDAASVYPREVVKRALELNAAALIIAHNHPSGECSPSRADQTLTTRVKEALGLMDMRLLDHFIVGEGTPYSFAGHGEL